MLKYNVVRLKLTCYKPVVPQLKKTQKKEKEQKKIQLYILLQIIKWQVERTSDLVGPLIAFD